jgi:RNA-directed DNA polymerase
MGHWKATEMGTPQGGIISPALCNIALNGLEDAIKAAYKKKKGITPGVKIIRYADDTVITGKNPEILKTARKVMERFLEIRGLSLNAEKTKITNIQEGIDFLGFNLRRRKWDWRKNDASEQEDVLIIRPSKKGVQNIMEKIGSIITQGNSIKQIVIEVNPILRGWAEHKRIVPHAREEFYRMDNYI